VELIVEFAIGRKRQIAWDVKNAKEICFMVRAGLLNAVLRKDISIADSVQIFHVMYFRKHLIIQSMVTTVKDWQI
jgi:hypothetical protein